MSVSLFTKYCVDTSALIDLSGRLLPATTFPDLFARLDAGFASDLLVSPREVRRELQNGSAGDDLERWATENPAYFVDPDDCQLTLMAQLMAQYPQVYDSKLHRSTDADPWVIVLAQAHGLTVVTSENQDSPKKIPHFCRELGVPVVNVFGFFECEGWAFNLGEGASEAV